MDPDMVQNLLDTEHEEYWKPYCKKKKSKFNKKKNGKIKRIRTP